MNTSGRITKTIRHSHGSTSAAHRASYEVTQVRYYIFSILFFSLFNAMNSSRKKKQRKTTTKMGEIHHIYIWYDGSSKQSGGGQPSISLKHFFSDVLALYNMYVLSSVRQTRRERRLFVTTHVCCNADLYGLAYSWMPTRITYIAQLATSV